MKRPTPQKHSLFASEAIAYANRRAEEIDAILASVEAGADGLDAGMLLSMLVDAFEAGAELVAVGPERRIIGGRTSTEVKARE